MEPIPRGPSKPIPAILKPVCAGPNCGGQITSSLQSLDEITCPCGYGYYDRVNHRFVPGLLVRSGQAPSRADYVTHVRQCSKQEKGAPVLGVAYVGHQSGEPQGLVYLGASSGRPQSQRPSEPYATGRHESAISDAHRFGSYGDSNEPSRDHKSDVKARSIFLSEDRAELEPVRLYLQLLNAGAKVPFEWREDILKGKRGWTIIGPRQLPYKAAIDIEQDTIEWRKEAIRLESAGVSYTRSKTWEKRQKSGVISLGDDELQKGAQSATLSLRTHGQSAHSKGNRKKSRHDELPEVSDEDDAQPRVHTQKKSQAKDILSSTTRSSGSYGSGDDENKASLPRRSKDLGSTTRGSPRFSNDDGGEDDTFGSGGTRRGVHDDYRDSGLSMSPPVTRQHSDPSTSRRSGRRDTADSKSSRPYNRGGKYEDDRPKGGSP